MCRDVEEGGGTERDAARGGNRSQITSSTEVYKDSCGGDIRVLIIGGVLIREY